MEEEINTENWKDWAGYACVTQSCQSLQLLLLEMSSQCTKRRGREVPKGIYSSTTSTVLLLAVYFGVPFVFFKLTPPLHVGVQQESEGWSPGTCSLSPHCPFRWARNAWLLRAGICLHMPGLRGSLREGAVLLWREMIIRFEAELEGGFAHARFSANYQLIPALIA